MVLQKDEEIPSSCTGHIGAQGIEGLVVASQGVLMSRLRVFYATLLYGEYTYETFTNEVRMALPEGCYLHFTPPLSERHWYRLDLTPVLIEDVPKEIKMLCLVMGIPLTP